MFDIVLNLLTVGANLAFMGIPVWAIMALDRHRNERRGWKYYLLALVLVVAWDVLVFALADALNGGHRGLAANGLVRWFTVLADIALVTIPITAALLLDYYRKDWWRGWRYYALAFAIVAVLYILPFTLIYWSGFGRQIKTR